MRPGARQGLAAAAIALAVGAGPSCSFTTATGFTECSTPAQCGSGHACLQGYCIPLPAGCRRLEGSFDTANAVPLAALLPLGEDGGADAAEAQRLNAMRLALGEANERDGIRGRRFALYACDTLRTPTALADQVDWFVAEMGAPALFTSGNRETTATARSAVVRDAGTTVVSANATTPALIDLFSEAPAVWRTAPPDTLQGLVLAALLRTEPRYVAARRIGIVSEKSEYGAGVASALEGAVTRDGKTAIRIDFTLDPAGVDANQVLNGLVPNTPEVTVLIASARDVRSIIRAARARLKLTRDAGHQWMLSDSARDPSLFDAVTTQDLDGAFGTAPAQGAGVAYTGFRKRFTNRFQADPSDFDFTANSYDATYLVMLSAAWASSTGAVTGRTLSEGMRHLSSGSAPYELVGTSWPGAVATLATGASVDVEGASGSLNLDLDAGAPSAPYEVWQVVDGGFATVRLTVP